MLKETTFRWFELERVTVKSVKYSRQTLNMFVEGPRKDENVIQIDQTYVISQTRHDEFHYMRELTGCIRKTETQNLESPLSLSSDKCSLIAVALIYFHLPITPSEVASGKEFTTVQCVKTSVNLRKWKLVLSRKTIEFAIVNTATLYRLAF